MFLLSLNFVELLCISNGLWLYNCFCFKVLYMFKGDNWRVSQFDKKNYCWLFCGHCSCKVFPTLHNYKLAWVLPIHTRFDDLDLASRSQMCQNRKLFLDSCPAWFEYCMVLTDIKKIRHSMRCVTGVYLKDVTSTIQLCTWMWVIWAFAFLVSHVLWCCP